MSHSLHSNVYFDNGIFTQSLASGEIRNSSDPAASFTVSVLHGDVVDDVANPTMITDAVSVPANKLVGYDAGALSFGNGNDIRRVQYRDNKNYVQLVISHHTGGAGEIAASPILSGLPFKPFYRENQPLSSLTASIVTSGGGTTIINNGVDASAVASIAQTQDREFKDYQMVVRTDTLRNVAPIFWGGAGSGDLFKVVLADGTQEIWAYGTPPTLAQTIEVGGAMVIDAANMFTPSFYSPVSLVRAFLGEWDASVNAVPASFVFEDERGAVITALADVKRGDLAIIANAGTVNGVAVAKSDLLHAMIDNPVNLTDWAIIKDCTAELQAHFTDHAQAVFPTGTVLCGNNGDPGRIDYALLPERPFQTTILHPLDKSIIYDEVSALADLQANSYQAQIESLTLERYTDSAGQSVDYCSTFTLVSGADMARFPIGAIVEFFSDIEMNFTKNSSKKARLGVAWRVLGVDVAARKLYMHGRIPLHEQFEAGLAGSNSIYATLIPEGRHVQVGQFIVTAAPTYVGNSVGWYQTLRGKAETVTITAGGNVDERVLIYPSAHHLKLDDMVTLDVGSIGGTSVEVLSVESATQVTVSIPDTDDRDNAVSVPSSGSIDSRPAFDRRNNQTHGASFNISYKPFSRFEHHIDRSWAAGLLPQHCHFGQYVYANTKDLPNHLTYNENLAGRIGYNVNIYACTFFEIIGHRNIGGRHGGFTTGAPETTNFVPSEPWNYGVTIHPIIDAGRSYLDIGIPYDEHEDCIYSLIKNCSAFYPMKGAYEGSYNGYGVQFRGMGGSLIDYYQRGGNNGVRVQAVDRSFVAPITFHNVLIEDTTDDGNDGAAMRCEDHRGKDNPPILVGDFNAHNCGVGWWQRGGVTANMDRLTVTSVREKGMTLEENDIFYADHVKLDFFIKPYLTGNSRNGIVMESNAKFHADKLTIVRGSEASHPSSILIANDSITGKLVDIGELVMRDPSDLGPLRLMRPEHVGRFIFPETSLDIIETQLFAAAETIVAGVVAGTENTLSAHLALADIVLTSFANVSGNITVDVLFNGISIFGSNKLVIPDGSATSVGATPPTWQTMAFERGGVFTYEILTAGTNNNLDLDIAIKGKMH